MSKPRIAFVAFTLGTGMSPLILATCAALKSRFDLRLFVPAHFRYSDASIPTTLFPSAKSKYARGLAMLDPRTHHNIAKEIEAFKPDLVHLFNAHGYPWSVTLMRFCRKKGIPAILTVHDPVPHPANFLDSLHHKLGAISARNATLVHLFNKRYLESERQRFGRPTAFADYISIAQFYLMHAQAGVAKENAILQFGRLEYYKGIDRLVNAAPLLPPGMKVIIAGPGKVTPAVRDAIEASPDRFELHEKFLTDREVAELFQRARVSVLPYREVTQSLHHVIAAEFGVTTVASDMGFFHDEVPRFNGLVVNSENPNELADAIVRASTMAPVIPLHYATETIVAQYADMYRAAIDLQPS